VRDGLRGMRNPWRTIYYSIKEKRGAGKKVSVKRKMSNIEFCQLVNETGSGSKWISLNSNHNKKG